MKAATVGKLGLGLVALGMTGLASATGLVDYSTISTAAVSEVGSAVTGALPIAGPVIGIFVGWRIFRRMAK